MKKCFLILTLCFCLTLSACCCPIIPSRHKEEAPSLEETPPESTAAPVQIATEPITEPPTEAPTAPPAEQEIVVEYYETYTDYRGVEYTWVEPYPMPVANPEKDIYDKPAGTYIGDFETTGYYTIVEQAEDRDGYTWGRLSTGEGWTLVYQQALPELEMTYASGVGAWASTISISGTGFFTGNYYDLNMGESGMGHPNGTRYFCDFNGKLNITDVGQYTVTLKLAEINTEHEPGAWWIEDGVMQYPTGPAGMEDCTYFTLYMPHTPINWVPDEVLDQAHFDYYDTLGHYALYNPSTGAAFFSW